MADLNDIGSITARCPGCGGGTSVFVWKDEQGQLGVVARRVQEGRRSERREYTVQYRLFRCSGCGAGALGAIKTVGADYPSEPARLLWFVPEAKDRLQLPEHVPQGIRKEFQEAERCLESECFRAAAALFRSVLDKTLRHNGYKPNRENLAAQIDAATGDGILTTSRKRRAHEDIRVLGNDVLHDEWRPLNEEDVQPAHRYVQRILEDFYDDRDSVLAQLKTAGREVEDSQADFADGGSD